MTSYKYVEKIGSQIPEDLNKKDEKLVDQSLATIDKNVSVTKSDYHSANVKELPKTSKFMFNSESAKGHGIIGGFDSISGRGNVGTPDSSNKDHSERDIKKTGLGYDIAGRMHYLNSAASYNFSKPKDFELEDCDSYIPPLPAYDYGFTKMAEWGYKSTNHGLHTTLLQIPGAVKVDNEDTLKLEIKAVDRAQVGARSAFGYHKQLPITEKGYLPKDIPYKDKLATLSAGLNTLPSSIPFRIPFGYDRGSGYNGQGKNTVNKVPLSTHPGPKTGKLGPVGFNTPILMNSSYPVVRGKLVA